MKISFTPQTRRPVGTGGKVLLSLFFGVFFTMGLVFEVMIARSVWKEWAARRWPAVECVIAHCEVVRKSGQDSDPYTVTIQYRYRWRDVEYQSDRLSLQTVRFSDYSTAGVVAAQYPVGTTVTGYVNPQNPGQAILRQAHPAKALILLFPLIFIAIGAGGIWFVWRAPPAEKLPQSLSQAAGKRGEQVGPWFFAIFLIFGLAGTWWLSIRPTLQVVAARSWVETPCRILASDVRSHKSDDGTTYSVDILYEYQVNRRAHRSSRYHFLGGSSSGYEGKQDVVWQYRVGSERVCYVNPHDPHDAVLHRGFRPLMLVGLLPLIFVVIGIAGLVHQRRQRAAEIPVTRTASGPVELKPQVSPLAGLVGVICICLFWNGIVSVFLYQAWRGFQSGRTDWFLALFLIPFVLVGLGLVGAVIYQLLALFNPRPRLTVSAGTVRLGAVLDLRWEIAGNARAIERLHIWVEGREEIAYQSGKNRQTAKEIFMQLELLDTTRHTEILAGTVQLRVPPDTMHSFEAGSQKVVWTLHLRGHIKWYPDVRLEFPLTVQPLP